MSFEKFRICYIPRADHIDVLRVPTVDDSCMAMFPGDSRTRGALGLAPSIEFAPTKRD